MRQKDWLSIAIWVVTLLTKSCIIDVEVNKVIDGSDIGREVHMNTVIVSDQITTLLPVVGAEGG